MKGNFPLVPLLLSFTPFSLLLLNFTDTHLRRHGNPSPTSSPPSEAVSLGFRPTLTFSYVSSLFSFTTLKFVYKISMWKKIYMIYNFLVVRKIIGHTCTFFSYCIVLSLTILVAIPFLDDELEYIENLDPDRDAEILRSELPMIRDACLPVLYLCTTLLKEAAAQGLCLTEIGEMMSREFLSGEEEPSELEVICIEARRLMDEELSSPNLEQNLLMISSLILILKKVAMTSPQNSLRKTSWEKCPYIMGLEVLVAWAAGVTATSPASSRRQRAAGRREGRGGGRDTFVLKWIKDAAFRNLWRLTMQKRREMLTSGGSTG
ncbi:phosphatidylinositol 4-kinase gamma 7-like isoform X2 [Salvia divinorum]|uniref:1-phosphatidylinositol 4-kinase n=1 Tax=Salvia divinorum TaxID=28513 RepID=A0ABD1G063_SALDI